MFGVVSYAAIVKACIRGVDEEVAMFDVWLYLR